MVFGYLLGTKEKAEETDRDREGQEGREGGRERQKNRERRAESTERGPWVTDWRALVPPGLPLQHGLVLSHLQLGSSVLVGPSRRPPAAEEGRGSRNSSAWTVREEGSLCRLLGRGRAVDGGPALGRRPPYRLPSAVPVSAPSARWTRGLPLHGAL